MRSPSCWRAVARSGSSTAAPSGPTSSRRSCTPPTASPGRCPTPRRRSERFRPGGALYPLELYVACTRVDETEQALYHYDPLRHGLERLRDTSPAALAELSPYGDLLVTSAAVVLVTGVFWRSRFKYGDRAYRFTLLEAGHVGQNLVLAATTLGLGAVPIGGLRPARDAFLGIDGLHEASLYLFPLGGIGG